MRRESTRLLLSVYIPTGLLAFGQGILVPVLPLYAKELGGSYTLAGLVVAAAWIGTMVSDLPMGMLLARIGQRRAMLIGAGLFAVATVALGFTDEVPVMIVYRLAAGIGTAMWGLSRHAYITQAVPAASRGRALSVFGGINRIGQFAGPAVGGLVASQYGLPAALIAAGLAAGVATLVAVVTIHDRDEPVAAVAATTTHSPLTGLRGAVTGMGHEVAAAGTAQVFGQMIRAGRQIVIPLFGAYAIGLDELQVGQIVSLSAMIDMLLFIPAGIIMDRFGRKAAAVPSFSLMAAGMALVPFTSSYGALLAAALLIGFGNGIGSGTMMTLGADLAPPDRTGEFLGLWRLIGDAGQAAAPLAVGSIADLIGLPLTAGAVSGMGVLAAAILALFVRETRWTGESDAREQPIVTERSPGD